MFLKPRFALLGDWNCSWDLSFNVPTDDVLKQHISGASYKFEYSLGHLFPKIASDVYELSIALPEGAHITKYSTGSAKPTFFAKSSSYSYLDFLGRPTLVFTFLNYLPSVHPDAKLTVEYTFEGYLVWIEPMYLVIGLLICFTLYIFLSKMDLTFGSEILEEKAHKEMLTRDRRQPYKVTDSDRTDKVADKKKR